MDKKELKGIEVYHSSHTDEEMKYYLDIANKLSIGEVKYELLPQNKVEVIEDIINNKNENDLPKNFD